METSIDRDGTFPIYLGDLNGDGRTDIAFRAETYGVFSIKGNGDGTTQPNQVVTQMGSAPTLAVSDLNGDGLADVVVGSNSGLLVIFSEPDGGYGVPQAYLSNVYVSRIAAGDFDGDGDVDLAVSDSPLGTADLLLNAGDGTFTQSSSFNVGGAPDDFQAADLDGDGKLDLIGSRSNGRPAYTRGHGDGTFDQPVTLDLSRTPMVRLMREGPGPVDVYGFDPNGLAVVHGLTGSSTSVWPGYFNSFAVADLNGDGRPDLVATLEYPASGVIFQVRYGLADGGYDSAIDCGGSGTSSSWVEVGDFNGDGKPDLAVVEFVDWIAIYLAR